jgi:hypothetical protein
LLLVVQAGGSGAGVDVISRAAVTATAEAEAATTTATTQEWTACAIQGWQEVGDGVPALLLLQCAILEHTWRRIAATTRAFGRLTEGIVRHGRRIIEW